MNFRALGIGIATWGRSAERDKRGCIITTKGGNFSPTHIFDPNLAYKINIQDRNRQVSI